MTETYKRGVSWNWELHHCSIDRVSNKTSWLSQFKRKISRIRDIHHQLDRLSHFVEFQDGKQHHNRSEIYTFIAKNNLYAVLSPDTWQTPSLQHQSKDHSLPSSLFYLHTRGQAQIQFWLCSLFLCTPSSERTISCGGREEPVWSDA